MPRNNVANYFFQKEPIDDSASYRLVRVDRNTMDYEQMIVHYTEYVDSHPLLRTLFHLLKADCTTKPYWHNRQPRLAWKPYRDYGARALLYIMLRCTEPLGPHFISVVQGWERYRAEMNRKWQYQLNEGEPLQRRLTRGAPDSVQVPRLRQNSTGPNDGVWAPGLRNNRVKQSK